MERAKTITIIILLLGLLLSIGYTFYLHKNSEPPEVIYVAHTDTLTLTDTIINQHTQIRYITTHDTLITYVHDSITDTIHFEIPIEHKTYRDTITNDSTTYDIHIDYSGYNSNIDRLEIKTQW